MFPCVSVQVVYNVGLCICLYDITKLDDSYIFPGDGAAHTKGTKLFYSDDIHRHPLISLSVSVSSAF